MKEKDRLRKEYVEELRKRHEEEASRLEAQLAKEQRARREEQAARVEVIPPESESAPNICLVPAQAPLFTFALCVCSQHDLCICPFVCCVTNSRWNVSLSGPKGISKRSLITCAVSPSRTERTATALSCVKKS